MRHSIAALALMILLVVVGQLQQTADSAPPDEKTNAQKKDPPGKKPKADDEPLLLLDDDGPSETDSEMADNSRCHVCHLDFAEEPIALGHAKAGIGCTKCHGDCDEHIADESWATGGNGTPPGKLFYRKDVDPCCEDCHKEHNVPARKIIAFWHDRHAAKADKPPTAAPRDAVCTDCHGEHKMHLKQRKCKWKK